MAEVLYGFLYSILPSWLVNVLMARIMDIASNSLSTHISSA